MTLPGDRGPRDRESSEGASPSRRSPNSALQGTVREALPNAMYSVELDDGRKILGHVATSLQTRTVRILPGDRVSVEVSPYAALRGRITERHR